MASPGHKVLCGAFTRSAGLETKALFQEEECCSLFECVLTQLRWFFVLFLFCFLWLSFGEIRLRSLLGSPFAQGALFFFFFLLPWGEKNPQKGSKMGQQPKREIPAERTMRAPSPGAVVPGWGRGDVPSLCQGHLVGAPPAPPWLAVVGRERYFWVFNA